MELVFRKLAPAESVEPPPGDVYLLPAAVDQRQRRDLARLVLEKGVDGLLRGSGKPLRIVIDADPKFDDMLAALFVQRLLQGQPISDGFKAYAQYAALLREGLRPTSFPLTDSLEGVYLAIRGGTEKVLTDPEAARQFLADWTRLADAICTGAEQGTDPFMTSFFDPQGELDDERRTYSLKSINRAAPSIAFRGGFLREQAFLAKDLEVYRQDVAQGEKWDVRLSGGPARAEALLLRQPKSLLFKYWTRSPCPAPLGGPFPFLAVSMGGSQWVFSTDPAQKLSLKPLAEALQNAERKQAPGHADRDPWFDGKSVQHNFLASPRAGTRLSEATVLRFVRKCCRARPFNWRRNALRKVLLAGSLAIAVALLAFFGYSHLHRISAAPGEIHDLYVLSVGVSNYQKLGDLPNSARDADALAAAFKKQEGTLCPKVAVKVLKDDQATRSEIIETGIKSWLLQQQTPTSHSLVVLTFSGHGFIEGGSQRYHFAPQDYDRSNQGSTGIFLADLQRYLDKLPCTVVLIFDTCHSGAVNEDEEDDPDTSLKTIQKFVKDSGGKKGLVVMAACARYQKANETDRWGHGALTIALLEGIEGAYHYRAKDLYQTPLPKPNETGMITLYDLDRYVTDRVEVLASEISSPKYRRQAAKTYSTGGISLEQIPIAVYADAQVPIKKAEPGK
jgi:Caspase domain